MNSRPFSVRRRLAVVACASVLAASASPAQEPPTSPVRPPADKPATVEDQVPAAITRCVEFLLSAQEAHEAKKGAESPPETIAEWPYEGVYRVGGKIPIGYRIGGTSIASVALLLAPGYADDAPRKQAVLRAVKFVTTRLHDKLMNPDYEGGYDVRGWGYTYALQFLLTLKSTGALAELPDDLKTSVEDSIKWCIDAVQQTEINEAGGWNYARQQGKKAVSPPSPFMTGPTLQALFEAKKLGYPIDPEVVERGLKSLERGRAESGSIAYAGKTNDKSPEPVPGAVGRMLITEITLHLAGRSDTSRIRGALDAFLVHWEWLDKRRAKPGTHEPPYGIAPYYFYYAHAQAAQAIEMLPRRDRAEYRRRLYERLFSVRLENGTWNDRVFPRTASYGTSQALLVMLMPKLPEPARWVQQAAAADRKVPAQSEP
ncbi:MAG: hypothetical protein IT438_13395 [Phycisphaerales bacterium]|nr:hypothetical protein [Phycisphaerales bacterium]